MKGDDLSDTPDYMQSLALIAKFNLNYLTTSIMNLAKTHCTGLCLAFSHLYTWTTNLNDIPKQGVRKGHL